MKNELKGSLLESQLTVSYEHQSDHYRKVFFLSCIGSAFTLDEALFFSV